MPAIRVSGNGYKIVIRPKMAELKGRSQRRRTKLFSKRSTGAEDASAAAWLNSFKRMI